MSTMSIEETPTLVQREEAKQIFGSCDQCKVYATDNLEKAVDNPNRVLVNDTFVRRILTVHLEHGNDDQLASSEFVGGDGDVVDAEIVDEVTDGEFVTAVKMSTELATFGDSLKASLLQGWFTEPGCISYAEKDNQPFFEGRLMNDPTPEAQPVQVLGLKLTLAEELGADWPQARVVSTTRSLTLSGMDDVVDEVHAEPLEFWIHHQMPSGRNVILETEVVGCREIGHKQFMVGVFIVSVVVYGDGGGRIMGPTPFDIQEGMRLMVNARDGSCEAYFTPERRRNPSLEALSATK